MKFPIFLIFCLFSTGFGQRQVLPEERKALIQLYQYTNGTSWSNRHNWLKNDPCIQKWHGIGCELDSNSNRFTITSIKLVKNNLSGRLPYFINYEKLKSRKHAKNHINEKFKIPPDVSNEIDQFIQDFQIETALPNLKFIDLSSNLIIGEIPKTWPLMKNLISLELEGNKLGGELPQNIGEWNQLEILFLHDNHFSGELPKSFIEMKKLKICDLHDNFFQGELDPNIQFMPHLISFAVYANNFNLPLPQFIKNLEHGIV